VITGAEIELKGNRESSGVLGNHEWRMKIM
jgi:hypothetical protein